LKPMDNFEIQVVQLPRVASPLCSLAMFDDANIKCVTIALGESYLKAEAEIDVTKNNTTYKLKLENIQHLTQRTAEATTKYVASWAKAHKARSEKKKEPPGTKGVDKAKLENAVAENALKKLNAKLKAVQEAHSIASTPASKAALAKAATAVEEKTTEVNLKEVLLATAKSNFEKATAEYKEPSEAEKELARVSEEISTDGLAGTPEIWWAWNAIENTIMNLGMRAYLKEHLPNTAENVFLQCTSNEAEPELLLHTSPSTCFVKGEGGSDPTVSGLATTSYGDLHKKRSSFS